MEFTSLILKFIGSHRFLNRRLRKFLPLTFPLKFKNNFKLFLDPKDLYGPSYAVMYSGESAFYQYEIPVKTCILKHLKSDAIFFDIGANVGLISFFISIFRPDVKIFSFEPSIENATALKKTIDANRIQNIQLIKKGVSEKSINNAKFYIDSKSSGGHSLIKSAIGHSVLESVEIELISLDDFVNLNKVIPNVIKIDVQDAEKNVLMGARDLIKKHQPMVIVEINNHIVTNEINFYMELFEGYKVSTVENPDKIVPVNLFLDLVSDMIKINRPVIDYVFFI